MCGLLPGITSCFITTKVYLGMKQSKLRTGFICHLFAVISLTAGIAANGFNELFSHGDTLFRELIFESFVYLGILLTGIGSYKIAKFS